MNTEDTMKKLDVFLLVALMALWGLNFSVIKLGVNHVEPLLLTAMRFAFASFPLLLFIKRPDVPWRYLMAYGLSFGVGVWGLTTLAVYAGTSAGMASLLLDMSVVSSLLVGYVCLNERITRMKLLGSAFALAGLAIIIRFNGGAITTKGLILVLLASVCWSVNGLIVKRAGTRAVFAFNIWAMAFAPLPLVLLASWIHGPQAIMNLPAKIDAPALFSALFQAYPTTLLGYWFWNKMMVKYSVSSVAPMTLLVPVFGLLGGYLFYQEQLILPQVLAAVLILAGLMIGEMRGWRQRPARLQSVVD
ncbi:EamA family transporter [Gynuella sunshinyii]|uniref:Putative permease, DMT superfamily n=1 Tax=Gynuella sunshinyii YC6258 TaxID=1445510 RepID=A0A0C5VE91_9GAMM|nr:EamA family transporter [Gynuella sunshinyii]AJQ92531.1 putative permease, DMT superfamily [Gynuella sunshinyii YC6258]